MNGPLDREVLTLQYMRKAWKFLTHEKNIRTVLLNRLYTLNNKDQEWTYIEWTEKGAIEK